MSGSISPRGPRWNPAITGVSVLTVVLVVLAPALLTSATHPPRAGAPSRSESVRVLSSGGHFLARGPPRASSTALTWWNITNETSTAPGPFWFTEGTWDAADGYLLTFGGDNFASTIWGTTYAYRSGAWSTVSVNGSSPPPLDGPALAYDPAVGRVVMYGGYESYSPFKFTNLTFTYANGSWSSTNLNPHPPAPTAAAMAYDPDLGGVVMFAGYNNSDSTGATLLNDLWLYKNGSWQALPDASPPSTRTWPSLAYDPVHHDVVMYGGINAASSCYGDTWTYDGTWKKMAAQSGGPPGLYGTQMTYDPDLGAVVLTGGVACGGSTNSLTWAFNGSSWNSVSVAGAPGPHLYGVCVWDPVDQVLIETAGTPGRTYTDVLSAPLRVVANQTPSTIEVGENAAFGLSLAGGVPARNVTWNWGDGSPGTSGANASHTFNRSGSYPVTAEVVDRAGSRTSWQGTVNVSARPTAHFIVSYPLLEPALVANFTPLIAGGVGPFNDSWNFGDGRTAVGAVVHHAFASSGTFNVTLMAKDAAGAVASARQVVTVVPGLSAGILGGAVGEVGTTSIVSAQVAGGVPPYSYNWSLDGTELSSLRALSLTFGSPGTHTVTVKITDSDFVTLTDRSNLTVAAAATAHVTGPTRVSAGSSNLWTVSITGGVAPFAVSWSATSGASGSGENASPVFSNPGQYSLEFFVNDSANGSATALVGITVGPSGASSEWGGISLTDWALIGAAGAIAAILAGAVIWRRRRRVP